MALALNTAHPLYANIVAFVCVDDDNLVKDLKGDSCTADASVVIGTGTYGRHFKTTVVSNNAKGVALTNGHETKPIANPVGTTVAIFNAGNQRVSRGSVTDSAITASNSVAVDATEVAGCQTGTSFALAIGTTDVIGTGSHMIAAAWDGTTQYKTWVDGNQENLVSGNLGNASATPTKYIGGTPTGGYGGFAADYVYYIHFRKYLSEAELDEIYTSLGAGNQISLLESSGTTPIAFTGTIPTQTFTNGDAVNVDLSTYFSGTQTPFTYSLQSGTLPTGLSLNSSTGVISGTPTVDFSGSVTVRATDTGTNTADTNSFLVSIAAAATASFTLTDLVNNAGAPIANASGITVDVYNQSTGALVVRKTGLTSTAGADLVVSDAALVAATTYNVFITIGTAIGAVKATAA